jgi:hypothetical protein
MALTIAQSANQIAKEWWKWAVWIEGSKKELSTVESVTYFLHPTFAQPKQVLKNRAEKFRFEEEGWGEFAIRARVDYLDRRRALELQHWLKLGAVAKDSLRSKPAIFISSSAADAPAVTEMRKAIEGKFDVRDASDVPVGNAWSSSIPEAIGSNDAVVAVFSDATSGWVSSEVAAAIALKLPVIAVTIGHKVQLPKSLHKSKVLRIGVPGTQKSGALSLYEAGEQIGNALNRQFGLLKRGRDQA